MRIMRARIVAGMGLVVLLGACHVGLAETPSTRPYEVVPATAPATPPPSVYWGRYGNAEPRRSDANSIFAGGRFDLSFGAEGFTARGAGRDDTIVFVTGAFRYTIITNLSLGLEVGLAPGTVDDRHHHHHNDDDRDGIRAVEELGVVRWHFVSTDSLSLFIDGGFGGLHGSHDFPTGGRRDNLLGVAGGGLTLRLADHCYLSGGARYARLGSSDWDDHHNHGHRRGSDGVQYYGGLSFVF